MDGSAYRNLPIGTILVLAIFGLICAAVGGVAGIAYAAWWIAHHMTIN